MPPLPKPSFAFGLKPVRAIEHLRSKGFKLTFDYKEMQREAHHKAFTVAKVTRLDLLSDIHSSITDAMEKGTRFEDWKKQIIPTLEAKGWWGKKEIVNPSTGEVKEVVIGGRRLKTIFKTNTMVARATTRYDQQMSSDLPYLQYVGGLSEHPRMSHMKKNGVVLLKSDPWWQSNYPPNAWGCKCEVRAWSEKQIQKRGWEVSTAKHENIATPDWSYNPGAGSSVAKLSKIDLDKSLASLPKLSDAKHNEYATLTEEQLKKRFYGALGIKSGDMYVDKIGDPMTVDDNLFTDKNTGESKLTREERHAMIDEFSKVISDPDEIYLDSDKFGMKKNMFRYYEDNGEAYAVMAVFRYFKDKTQGATIFHVTRGLEARRKMRLVYQRGRD